MRTRLASHREKPLLSCTRNNSGTKETCRLFVDSIRREKMKTDWFDFTVPSSQVNDESTTPRQIGSPDTSWSGKPDKNPTNPTSRRLLPKPDRNPTNGTRPQEAPNAPRMRQTRHQQIGMPPKEGMTHEWEL
jgi:hypothetical protein